MFWFLGAAGLILPFPPPQGAPVRWSPQLLSVSVRGEMLTWSDGSETSSYTTVKGRRHSVEERISTHIAGLG